MPQRTRKLMVSRKEKHLREVLRMNLFLPYNQRPKAWKKLDVTEILGYFTILGIFEGELSQLIFPYYEMRTNFYWDGQQRILTTIIFIIALSKFYTPFLIISNYSICCLSEFDSCEEDYQTLQDEFGDSLVPRVRCVYKNDREALSKILNQKFLHINEYTKTKMTNTRVSKQVTHLGLSQILKVT